jgi:hypothetical protein
LFGDSLARSSLAEFMKFNPMKFVPALVDGDAVIGDSYAIVLASIVMFLFVVVKIA